MKEDHRSRGGENSGSWGSSRRTKSLQKESACQKTFREKETAQKKPKPSTLKHAISHTGGSRKRLKIFPEKGKWESKGLICCERKRRREAKGKGEMGEAAGSQTVSSEKVSCDI